MNEEWKHNQEEKGTHRVTLCDRTSVSLTGIEDVISFDETAVVLATTQGTLAIEGENLHILQMNVDSKEFGIHGKICSLCYVERRAKGRGLLRNKS